MARKRTFGNVYESRGRWRVRYSIDGRRFDVAGGDTRADAEAVLARVTLERARARLDGRPVGKPVTLAQFAPRLWAIWDKTLRPATISSRGKALKHYSATLRQPMMDVTEEDAQEALLARLGAGLRVSSVETERRILSAAWGVAIRLRVAQRNPWSRKKVNLPTAPTEEHRRCTEDEILALYRHASHDLVLPLLLMREAGLRRGEVVTLLWADVAQDRSRVTVRGRNAKSHKARTVPATPRLREGLERAPPALPTARVCPLTLSRLNHGFRDLADGLGLDDVTPHTLRHTFAHRMAEAGVNVYVLRDLLGHASVTTTEVYMGSASARAMRDAVAQAERHRTASGDADAAASM